LIKFPSRPNKPGVIPLAGQAAPPAVAEAEKPDADEQKGGAAHAEQATSADLRAVVLRDIKDAMELIAPADPTSTNSLGNVYSTM